MQYMLLIYNNPATYAAWSEQERATIFADVDAIMKEITESGELIATNALADASQAKTVRVRDGLTAITDGPFAEAKEQFAGYLLLECESPDRALDIAARWPDARYFAMEVRPIMDTSGSEM